MTKNILKLENPIQIALFRDALLPQIVDVGGRWNGVKPIGHFEPFVGIKVSMAKDGEPLGVNFPAKKLNYNFNDSNWVNDAAVTPELIKIASAAAKKEVSKKEVYFQLARIKEILKASNQVFDAPAEVAEVEKESAPVQPELVAA